MATHTLKPKDVIGRLDIKFVLKKKEKDHDKHEKGQKKSISKSEPDQSDKETG